jgi:Flp pilus assembly protein CpaB
MPRFRRPRSPVHTARQVLAGLLLLAALVLALRPGPQLPTARAPATVPVAVAARDLPAGRVLVAADLAVARFPPPLSPAGTAPSADPLLGAVVASGIRAGEPVTDVRLVGAGLTALLPPGQVAAPVRLADLAVTALVRTGDRVDVLATPPEAPTADVVAGNALVLAAPDMPVEPAGEDPGVLVLAVDPATAARLAAAATTSTITVSLTPS